MKDATLENDRSFRSPWWVPGLLFAGLISLLLAVVVRDYCQLDLCGVTSGVLREIGVTALIAWGVAITIERAAEHHRNQIVHEHLEAIKDNYYNATFKNNFSEAFLAESKNIFSLPIHRSRCTLDVHLSPEDPQIQPADLNSDTPLRVETSLKFRVTNISEVEQTWRWSFAVHIDGLENKEINKVKSVSIDQKEFSPHEIEEADLDYEDTETHRIYQVKEVLKSEEHRDIVLECVYRLRARDFSTWVFGQPTIDGIRMAISYPEWLQIELDLLGGHQKPVKRSIMGDGSNSRLFQMSYEGVLLPHNGVTASWFLVEPPVADEETEDPT